MSESVQTTYEDATRCPKCGKPGDVRKKTSAIGTGLPRGTQQHHIYCMNELCIWYNTCWFVQVNPDGSVPAPKNHTGEPKVYQGFEGHDEAAKAILDGIKRQYEYEQSGDHPEIRRKRF